VHNRSLPIDHFEPALISESKTVLIVDDDPISRRLMGLMAKRAGVNNVITVATGKAALSEVARGNIDLVFIDWLMPDLDGLDVARALRATGYPKPIVLITASPMADFQEMSIEAGSDSYLSKPLRYEDVRETIEHWLN